MSALRVNQTKVTAENAFNPDYFCMKGNHESKNKGWSLYLGIFADSWFMVNIFILRSLDF